MVVRELIREAIFLRYGQEQGKIRAEHCWASQTVAPEPEQGPLSGLYSALNSAANALAFRSASVACLVSSFKLRVAPGVKTFSIM